MFAPKAVAAALIALLVAPLSALAQWNPAQGFQPFRQNWLRAQAGSVEPVFDVDFDSSVTPTVGTAGTFTRSGSMLGPNGKHGLQTFADATPVLGRPQGINAPTTAISGYIGNSSLVNYCEEASTFDSWTPTGTASVVANDETDPAGGATADKLIGGAASDSVTLTSGVAAASNTMSFLVWLKASQANVSVTIRLTDTGVTETGLEKTVTVGTDWNQYEVYGTFSAGAAGNIVQEIIVNDTTGYEVWAYGASLLEMEVNAVTSMLTDSDMAPTIITSGGTAAIDGSALRYAGSEMQHSNKQFTVAQWVYFGNLTWMKSHNYLWWWLSGFTMKFGLFLHSSYSALAVAINESYATAEFCGFNPPPENEWSHVAAAFDGDGDTSVYINGTEIYHTTTAFAGVSVDNFIVGGNALAGDNNRKNNFKTPIGTTTVWNDKRLTKAQIVQHFDQSKASYGYPLTGTQSYWSSTDILERWKLEEASDAVVGDNGTSVPVTGSPAYRVIANREYVNLGPGVRTSNQAWFRTTSETPTAATIGTKDFTVRVVFQTEAYTANQVLFDTCTISTNKGMYVYLSTVSELIRLYIRATGNTTVTWDTSDGLDPWKLRDGEIHEIVITADRDGNATLYFDGVSMGGKDISARNGEAIEAQSIGIGTRTVDDVEDFFGAIFEVGIKENLHAP